MKRNNFFIVLTLFAVISLCALVQLSAELTPLEQAEQTLSTADGKLGNANAHLGFAHTEMHTKYVEWTQNEEELNRDNLIATSTARDPAALAALGIMHAADISDKLRLSRELAGKIKTFNTKLQAVKDADKALQTAWNNYIPLAQHLSLGERYVIVNTAANPSPISASLRCPACLVKYSGENLGGIGDHITFCNVTGHNVSPYPYFSCESSGCPLSNEHHTFLCRGKCGKLFKQPTIISAHPTSQGVVNYTKVFHDDGYACNVDVPGPGNCPETAFKCRTPQCPNDANHLKDGECGSHKVRKGDAAAIAAHARLEGAPVACTVTLPNSDDGYGNLIRCIIRDTYVCSQHTKGVGCDFYAGVGTYPPGYVVSPPPTPTDNTPDCPDCTLDCSSPCGCSNSGTCNGTVTDNTPDCSYCTDGCSACPPQIVACGGASYTGCSGASSRTEHHVPSCGNCGAGYWTCSEYAYRHTDSKTCKRSGCGATLTPCQNGPTECINGGYHWL